VVIGLDAYGRVMALPAAVRDPIDLSALDAINVDAIGPLRADEPTDEGGAWTGEELRRWHAELTISRLRRRAAGRAQAGGVS
jgi:hypothetical protein